MRVLLDVSAVPPRPVGAGVYTVALARSLGARGDLDLHLLARADDATRWRNEAPSASVHAEAPSSRPARLVWEQAAAPSLAVRLGIDVWHGPHYTMPLRLTVPAVVTVHDLTFFDHPEWHERSKVAFFRRMIRSAARRASLVVCVSGFTESRLAHIATPAGETVVVHHGVDHSRFAPDDGSPSLSRGDLEILAPHGIVPPYVAFASTLEPRKDAPTLVHAFAEVARSRPDLRLVLAGGDGWGARAVREAIVASGVATRVIRPGYLPNEAIPAFFRRADVVAYPSLEEGFGLPALEALACGAPLVSTTGSAVEEVVGDAALLVAPGDSSALAAALTRVLGDASEATRLRRAGPPRAAPFTWSESIDRHVAAYRSVARAGVAH
ncbi:MAG: glycosyltransferase family 4 protein [Acidimicrobiia bacterium]|nr:glycosyltransferase family 4 protein [Acidimicrobiia bacterium]